MNEELKKDVQKLCDSFSDEVDRLKVELIATTAYHAGKLDGIAALEQRLLDKPNLEVVSPEPPEAA